MTATTLPRPRTAEQIAGDALAYAAQADDLAGTGRPPRISGAAISALLRLGPGAAIVTDPTGSRPRAVPAFDDEDWTTIVLLTYGEAAATCAPDAGDVPPIRPVDLGATLTAAFAAAAVRGAW